MMLSSFICSDHAMGHTLSCLTLKPKDYLTHIIISSVRASPIVIPLIALPTNNISGLLASTDSPISRADTTPKTPITSSTNFLDDETMK